MKAVLLVLPLALLEAAGPTPDIDLLIAQAQAVPGEFAADALIRIATLEQIPKARKVELLEQAFGRASEAQEPYRRRAAMAPDSPAQFLNHAYSQDLDALSLRLRVVQALLPLNGGKARELFFEIPPLKLPGLTCDDTLAYDVDRYYVVLGEVVGSTFTAAEIRQGEPTRLLEQAVGGIASPAQVAPVASLLLVVGGNETDFQLLLGAFGGALRRMTGDDRSYAYAGSAGARIQALAEACKRRMVSPAPLLESYRLYLVNHLTGARCAGDDRNAVGGSPVAVAFFNEELRIPAIEPIHPEETSPTSVEQTKGGARWCEDAECRSMTGKYRALFFNSDSEGVPYPASHRGTGEWDDELRQFLAAMDTWTDSTGAPPGAFYREKTMLYSDLFNLAPDGQDRELVLRAMLDCVRRSRYQARNRMEWFLPANTLIGRVGLDPRRLGYMWDALRQSDPVIALYANLEVVVPRGADQVMALL